MQLGSLTALVGHRNSIATCGPGFKGTASETSAEKLGLASNF